MGDGAGELPDPDDWVVPKAKGSIAFFTPYPKGFRLLMLIKMDEPKGWRTWRNLLWGFDIWFGRVPLAKSIVLANLIMWALMWVLR